MLSFLIGIVSGGKAVSIVLFRAVVFAAVFACVAVVVEIVLSKFLGIDTFSAQSTEAQDEEKRPTSGSIVDITLSDESLVDDGGASFNIGKNVKPIATAMPVPPIAEKKSASEPAETEKASEVFKPIQLANDTTPKTSEKPVQEEPTSVPSAKKENAPVVSGKSEEMLDDLPDIGDIVPELAVSEAVAEAVNTSFAGEPVSAPRASSSGSVSVGSENVAELAAAIRTVLAKDGA